MTYHVELSDRALRDLDALYREKKVEQSPGAARRFNRLESAMEGLATLPHRCPLAPEGRGKEREVRHLLFGRKPHVYRVLYEVDESQRLVRVFHIRHGAQMPLSEADFGES